MSCTDLDSLLNEDLCQFPDLRGSERRILQTLVNIGQMSSVRGATMMRRWREIVCELDHDIIFPIETYLLAMLFT